MYFHLVVIALRDARQLSLEEFEGVLELLWNDMLFVELSNFLLLP